LIIQKMDITRLQKLSLQRLRAGFVTICVQDKLKLFWNDKYIINVGGDPRVDPIDINGPGIELNINRADTGVRPYIKSNQIIRPYHIEYRNNLNDIGEMVLKIWNEIPNNYFGIKIDEFVIMPDHIHGILIIDNVGVDPCVDPLPLGLNLIGRDLINDFGNAIFTNILLEMKKNI
jgi:hypothetical protein